MTDNQTNQPHSTGIAADPAVTSKPKRRTYTAEYKLRILEEADRCEEAGEIGVLLRREGLYSSHLAEWRKLRRTGRLQALRPQQRGRKKDETAAEIAALRRENERLRTQLSQAELLITAQKKLSQALETLMTDENRS